MDRIHPGKKIVCPKEAMEIHFECMLVKISMFHTLRSLVWMHSQHER